MSAKQVTLVSAVLAALAVLGAGVAAAETIALTGGTVHTVSDGTVRDGTVLIEGDKIVGVGADVAVPRGAKVYSCAGKQVYPGFVSPNTILGLTEVSSVSGTRDDVETGDINPNIRAEVEINPESDLLPVARVNGVTSAVVLPRGGVIAGTAALIHLDGWTFEDMTVSAPVGLYVQWPNMAPVHTWTERRSDEDQMKARDEQMAALKKAFADARAYWKARDAEGEPGVPRHDDDIKWDAMGKALRGEIPVLFRAERLSQINAVLGFIDEQKLPKVILVGGDDAAEVADELARRDIAVVIGPTLELPDRSYEAYDRPYALAAALYQAGVKFCIGDGGTAMSAMNARNLPYQAATAAAFGLPRDEALKSITLYPAQIMGVGDRLGSIEAGKIADLVVTDGDPLEITTKVEQVFIAGKQISMENRQTRLFEKYDHRPRGPKARPR